MPLTGDVTPQRQTSLHFFALIFTNYYVTWEMSCLFLSKICFLRDLKKYYFQSKYARAQRYSLQTEMLYKSLDSLDKSLKSMSKVHSILFGFDTMIGIDTIMFKNYCAILN